MQLFLRLSRFNQIKVVEEEEREHLFQQGLRRNIKQCLEAHA